MHLPELELQIIYGRLGWGIMLAALVLSLLPRRFIASARAVGVLLAGMLAVQALPGAAAPAFWLGLAGYYPSGLLVGLCLAKLYLAGTGRTGEPVIPAKLALLLALAGVALYLDAFGLLPASLYYGAFGPYGAPLIALLLAAASAYAIFRDIFRVQACAVLFALVSFSVLRLPTGNLWDALLDPLLWGWALVSLGRQVKLRRPQKFANIEE